MEYEIKITGAGTRQQLLVALNSVIHNLLTFPDESLDAATWEDPTLCTQVSTYDEDEPQGDGRTFDYYVILDMDGYYQASINDDHDNKIWDIPCLYTLNELKKAGHMKDKQDMEGLAGYLSDLGVIPEGSVIRHHE